MNREIKFRAFTKDGKMRYDVIPFQWDYVIDRTMWKCTESNGNGILGSEGTEAKFDVRGFAINKGDLMQFTGLKDKDGREIYEGDIVVGNPNSDVIPERKFIIGWVYSGWAILHPVSKDNIADLGDIGIEFIEKWGEVVGDVFSNPELLD